MGNFIYVAAVLAPEKDVLNCLGCAEDSGACYAVLPDRTLAFLGEEDGFKDAQSLSAALRVPVIALHIHDDDLWMYELYESGELTDRFNTRPAYWETISEEQRVLWRGNPDVIANCWRDLKSEDVAGYLVHWDLPGFAAGTAAYPGDQFKYGDCWQMCDFLAKLGTPYPDEPDA